MLNTARTTPMATAPSPRKTQGMQRKHFVDGSSLRVLTTPIMTSFPHSAAVSLEPGFHADDRRNREQRIPHREQRGRYVAVTDARHHIPRQFLDSDRSSNNRKVTPNYPVYSRLQNGELVYQQPSSDYFLSSGYGDYAATDNASKNYSLVVPDDLGFPVPGSPVGSSDPSDSSPPTTPVNLRSQPISVPPTPSAQRAAHYNGFPSHSDVSYSTPHTPVAEPNHASTPRSGPDDNDPAGSGPFTAGEQSYAESVLSIESEDTVHRLARVNAKYNAAASAFYGSSKRDSASQHGQHRTPSIVPSVERVSTPRTPRASETPKVYTDGPLSSSPTQMSYFDDSGYPSIYRAHPFRGPPQINMQQTFPPYPPVPHPSSAIHPSSPSHDNYLPPLKPLDFSTVPPAPGNGPISAHPLPNDQYRSPSHFPYQSMRAPDRDNARPLPVPPPMSRRYSVHGGPPAPKEEILAHYDANAFTQEGAIPWGGEAVPQSLLLRDERRDTSPSRPHTNSFGDYNRSDPIPVLTPHGPRFITRSDDATSAGRLSYISNPPPPPPPHGPRFVEKSQSPERTRSSPRADRIERGSGSSLDDWPSDRSRSPRNRHERSATPAVGVGSLPPEQGRRRRDSLSHPKAADPRYITPSAASLEFILPPSLVPLVRQSPPRREESPRSPSRTSPPSSTHGAQFIYQPFSRSPSAVPEPHRRYSDGDAPAPFPPFFVPDTSSRATDPVPMITRSTSSARSVRWNDGPASRPQKREGWFNRRGDQLWTNDGMYMPAPAGQEYPPDLDDYPEYGEGWMNERGIRIDMGHRSVPKLPKAPLRPALKQTQPR